MAKVKGIQNIKKKMEQFKGKGRTGFFKLEDDGDSCLVRFLHADEDDFEIYIVHKVKIQGKDRWVECTEDETCPLCQSGNKPQLRMFLYMIDRRDGEVKLWERGQTFIPLILDNIAEYGKLNERDFKIVRHGKKGDTQTTYTLFPKDKKVEDDLPERPQVCGENGFILSKSHEDMVKIAKGTYTPSNNGGDEDRETGTDIF